MVRQSNFSQLLSVKVQDDPNLAALLRRKKNVCTAQNNIIKIMD